MKISEYLRELSTIDEPVGDLEFQCLLDGKLDTTTAARVWTEIADGSASVGNTLLWAVHVANQIKDSVINGSERDAAPAALKAIGFYGQVDPYRPARESMEIVAAFDFLDEQGNALPSRRLPASEWLRMLRKAGYLDGINDKSALNRINEWRKDLGIE